MLHADTLRRLAALLLFCSLCASPSMILAAPQIGSTSPPKSSPLNAGNRTIRTANAPLRQAGSQPVPRSHLSGPATNPSPARTTGPAPTRPFAGWVGYVLAVVGGVLFAVIAGLAISFRPGIPGPSRAGPALLAALPVVAALGLLVIPFAPNVDGGRWIPIEVLAVALMVGGSFFGFLYGLPIVDQDAVKAAGASAGTFLRPGTKLDSVIDSILPALTGGVVTFALTQASHFNTMFLHLAQLPTTSSSQLLGIGILAYFTPLGFMLSYTLTSTVGALAFKRAQETLVEQSAMVRSFPSFPDLPLEPTDDQIAAAKTIASRPYVSLLDASEKATWARAQTILENYVDAIRAYQDAIVLDPRNAGLIIDYATAIYNEPSIDDVPFVLQLVSRAETICGAQAPELLRQRIYALKAAAMLYQPGRYEDVIQLVNTWISGPVSATRFARFYRACAFGQLYESCAPAALPAAAPYVTLPGADDVALRALVRNDVALTLIAAQDKGAENVRMVMDPASPRVNADDDDLQLLAADDPLLRTVAGLAAPPPPPPAPHPPAPTQIPNPLLAPPGTLATWIAANCPT